MRILIFSINPLFPDKVNGGSPKQLQVIAEHLGALGHEVRILCTRHPDNGERFHWGDGVEIRPELRFKQPFPEPYAIPGYRTAWNFQQVADQLPWAERLYIHDGELLLPELYGEIPTVVSIRDNSYAESILGSFLFRGDALIAISDYSRRIFLATAGRFFPELDGRIRVIDNGVDHERFKPTPPSRELLDLLDFDPRGRNILLHPHRPDPAKGIDQSIRVAALLVKEYGIDNLTLLFPRWFDADHAQRIDQHYHSPVQLARELGIAEHIRLHPWIPHHLMAEYYSLGSVSLALGNCPEAFGNAVYESLSCGAPAIAARVSTYRELPPEELLDKVDYGDVDGAAAIAAGIMRERRRTSPATLAFLRRRLSIDAQRQAYAETIVNARKRPPLHYRHRPSNADSRFQLAPWCYRSRLGLFHDFLGEHHPMSELIRLLEAHSGRVSQRDAAALGVTPERFESWHRDGWLSPC